VGIPTAELVKLYDDVEDTDLRSALIDELSQVGTRDATTKLVAIANGDAMMTLRRRAVQVLGRVDDPKVREALKGMVER
jgi:HEAT repeat protein